MQRIACENGGIYHNIDDSEAGKLKEVCGGVGLYNTLFKFKGIASQFGVSLVQMWCGW